jgi:hypothetical protein
MLTRPFSARTARRAGCVVAAVRLARSPFTKNAGEVIPAALGADWYARGVGGAAAREINKIPAARLSIEESMFRAAGISCHRQGPTRHE